MPRLFEAGHLALGYAGAAMQIRTFTGPEVATHRADVARLRIEVFREYPYLYEGNANYEAEYLARYAQSERSLFVLAFDGPLVVGASTGMPLSDESAPFQKPFIERNLPLTEVFYFGESVLSRSYRGRGLGHRFFDEREAHARAHGFSVTAFCAVERDEDDPRRPSDYRPNDAFWLKRGYEKQPSMTCELKWKQLGDKLPSKHQLCFWLRRL
jgi:GNAT superfamily N-acetyltransferase